MRYASRCLSRTQPLFGSELLHAIGAGKQWLRHIEFWAHPFHIANKGVLDTERYAIFLVWILCA
jgi:hypothetical protein